MIRNFLRTILLLFAATSLVLGSFPATTHATFPGENGKINALQHGRIVQHDGCSTDTSQLGQTLFDNNLTNPTKINLGSGGQYENVGKISWAPDGSQYTFASVFQYKVGIANADGSSIAGPNGGYQMSVDPANASTTSWSPDGITLGIGSYGALHTFKFGDNYGGYSRLVTYNFSGFADMSWSPKGDYIAFVKQSTGEPMRDQIGIIQSDGTAAQLFPKSPSTSDDQDPDWSPDGNKIVFASNRSQLGTNEGNEPTQLFTMNPDGTGAVQMTSNYAYRYEHPVWSPDGTKILATRTTIGTTDPMDLVILDAGTGSQLSIYTPACNVGFSSIGWQPLGKAKIYRLANWKTQERLFTSRAEAVTIPQNHDGWILEGAAFPVYDSNEPGASPIYRLANWKTHERLFTTSSVERDYALAHYPGWVSEGIAFHATSTAGAGLIPVYRLANWKTHERLFTTSATERDYALAHYEGWVSEGIAFYAPSN